MVLHNQSVDISKEMNALESHIKNLGYDDHVIHTGPLIRKESVYKNELSETRKTLFNALFHFGRKIKINYISLSVNKINLNNHYQLIDKLKKELTAQILLHNDYFNSFDKINIYYDNGQTELTKILTEAFSILLSPVEFRKIIPIKYRLFQLADLICTMELINIKYTTHELSKSEIQFFGGYKTFKSDYYKYIKRKKLN